MAQPQPTDEELDAFYGPDYFAAFGYSAKSADRYRALRRIWFDRLLARVEQEFSVGRLLDVGSGLGDLLACAQQRHWEAVGVEANPFAVAAGLQSGASIHRRIEDCGAELGAFGVVTCTDVLEHLRSPTDALAQFHDLLVPGGGLVVTTIDVAGLAARLMGRRWFHIHRDHLWYFNRQVLARMSESAGFEVLMCRTATKTFDLYYVLHVLTHIRNSRTLARLCDVALRWTPAVALSRPFTMSEGLLLIARRPVNDDCDEG